MFGVPPGEMHVACLDPYAQDRVTTRCIGRFEIVDNEGVYVDAACSARVEAWGAKTRARRWEPTPSRRLAAS